MTDAEIIELLGGVTVVARYFEIKPPSVFGWLETGIPEVRLMALAPQLELRSNGRFTRKARWPETYGFFWPELAIAQAEHAPVATEYIAASTAALEKLEHAAEDQIAQLVTEARVDIKHIAGAVVSELLTAQRTVRGGAWDGVDRRTKGWDGTERRKGPDRRQPDVLEAPETVTPLAAKEA